MKKNLFSLFFIASLLTGCGSNLKCNQENLISQLNSFFYSAFILGNLPETATFWENSFKPRSVIELSDIKDLGLSENSKHRYCEATISISMPQPNNQSLIEYRLFLLSMKEGFKLNSDPLTTGNEFLNGEEYAPLVFHTFKYKVSEIENSNNKEKNIIEIEDKPSYVQNFLNPILYRMFQVAISDFVTFKPRSNFDNKDKNRIENYMSIVKKSLETNTSVPSKEKDIRICTGEKILSESKLDASLGVSMVFENLNKNYLSRMMLNEGNLKRWLEYFVEQRNLCTNGSKEKLDHNNQKEDKDLTSINYNNENLQSKNDKDNNEVISNSSNYDKKNILTMHEYRTNNGCVYREYSSTQQNNRSIFWDGNCQNGYLQGFGSLIIEDKTNKSTTVCEAIYKDGLENGQGKCTYNYNNNELFTTESGVFKNGRFLSGIREFENQEGQYKKEFIGRSQKKTNPDEAQETDNYAHRISKIIMNNQQYPGLAKMRGWQGTVIADLEIDSKGSVINVKIKKSSTYEVLDKQALEMIKKASPFPAPPDNLRGKNFNVLVPISFKLE